MDFAAFSGEYEVVADARTADIAHVYAAKAHVEVPSKRRWWSAGNPAGVFISPIEEKGFELVPEAVEEHYFDTPARLPALHKTVASFARPSLRNVVELTVARLHRTREDIEWLVYERPPSIEDLATIDAWIDPAIGARDFDGFVAEAVVAGLLAIAARTPINIDRLEKGRTGLLVPVNDPNELAHAILAGLFKPEVAQQKIDAARQTRSKFRPRQRLRALTRIYESL